MGALARTITSCAPNARRLIVIDACFAAAAVPDWLRQSDVASLIQKSTFDALSERGTALLCASSSADVALTPRNGKYTMFSGALIGALEEGDPEFPEKLSPSDIEHIVRTRILEAFQHDGVTPEIHMPDKREGDISKIPIFPNRASRVSYLSDQDLDKVRGLISGYRQQRILSERTIEGLRDYFFEEGEIRRPVADTVEANFLSHALKGAPTLERAILGGDFDRQKVRNEAKQLNFEAASRPTKAKTPEEQQTERQAITEPNSDSGLWKRRAEVFEATVKLGSAESNAKPLLGNEGDREVAGFPINRDDASVILVLLLISPLLMLCVIMGMNERSILADVLVLMTLGACAGGTLFVINLLRRGHNIVLTPWGLLVLDMIVLFTSLVILMFMRPDLLHLA
jgi:hypothetical protein